MTKKEKWKTFGKDTGHSFSNFGRAMATTAKIVSGNESNDLETNGNTVLRNAWSKTGKGFGKAGTSLGRALKGTFGFDSDAEEENINTNEEKQEETVLLIEHK